VDEVISAIYRSSYVELRFILTNFSVNAKYCSLMIRQDMVVRVFVTLEDLLPYPLTIQNFPLATNPRPMLTLEPVTFVPTSNVGLDFERSNKTSTASIPFECINVFYPLSEVYGL
jgi:hypothetical protein